MRKISLIFSQKAICHYSVLPANYKMTFFNFSLSERSTWTDGPSLSRERRRGRTGIRGAGPPGFVRSSSDLFLFSCRTSSRKFAPKVQQDATDVRHLSNLLGRPTSGRLHSDWTASTTSLAPPPMQKSGRSQTRIRTDVEEGAHDSNESSQNLFSIERVQASLKCRRFSSTRLKTKGEGREGCNSNMSDKTKKKSMIPLHAFLSHRLPRIGNEASAFSRILKLQQKNSKEWNDDDQRTVARCTAGERTSQARQLQFSARCLRFPPNGGAQKNAEIVCRRAGCNDDSQRKRPAYVVDLQMLFGNNEDVLHLKRKCRRTKTEILTVCK